jgi:hypothetical protein
MILIITGMGMLLFDNLLDHANLCNTHSDALNDFPAPTSQDALYSCTSTFVEQASVSAYDKAVYCTCGRMKDKVHISVISPSDLINYSLYLNCRL